jgi:hypothetical protein
MSLLAMGAGAGQGLEDLISQDMQQELLNQRALALQETQRSHMEDERLKGRQIDETAATRRALEAETSREHDLLEANRQRDDARARLGMLPMGTTVTPQEEADFIGKGAAVGGQFSHQPAYQPEEQGPAVPSGPQRGENVTQFRGTPTELAASARDQRMNDALAARDALGWANYERLQSKEPPESNQVVQSGQGYFRVPKQGGAATPVMGPDGQPLGLATTTPTRTMAEGAKMVKPQITRTLADAGELDRRGLFGPFMGRVREIATKIGTVDGLDSPDLDQQQHAMDALGQAIKSDPQLASDEVAGRFAARLGLLMTAAARVHGGARGGGSPQMLEHFKDILGGSSTLPLFRGKMQALDDVMTDYMGGGGGGGSQPGGGGGGAPDLIYDPVTKTFKRPGG